MSKSRAAQAASTVVLKPLGAGQLIKLGKPKIIGRSDRCDVVINHGGISRKHAKLTPGKWELQVEDLGSVNGTYVNDQKVSGQVSARHKDKIRFDTLAYEVRIVVDIDEIANIANIDDSNPPQPSVSGSAAASSAMDIDDMPVIQDTIPPPVTNRSRPVRRSVSESRSFKSRPAGVTSSVVRKPLSLNVDSEPKVNRTSTRSIDESSIPVLHHTVEPPLDRTAAVPSSIKPAGNTRSNTGRLRSDSQRPDQSLFNRSQSQRSFGSGPLSSRSLGSRSQRSRPRGQTPAWAYTGDRRSRPSNFAVQARRETVQMGVVDKSISLEKGGALLVGISGDAKGNDFSFSGRDHLSKWEIGRDESSDVMINDTSVSRNHAQLVNDKGRWKLIDLMSANGTYVNGSKCLTSYLDSGDTVRFGKLEFMFKSGADSKERSELRPNAEIGVVLLFAVVLGVVLFGFFSNSF